MSATMITAAHLNLPTEVWVHILLYLYPSQLVQVGQVSRYLSEIVTYALPAWKQIFQTSQLFIREPIPDHLVTMKGIKPSANTPRSIARELEDGDKERVQQDYIKRAVLAFSFRVCEQCFRVCCEGREGLASMPLKVSICTPASPTTTVTGAHPNGLPVTTTTIRLCPSCRNQHFLIFPEPIPKAVVDKRAASNGVLYKYGLSIQDLHKLPPRSGNHQTMGRQAMGHRWASEKESLVLARQIYGGDVGIGAVLLKNKGKDLIQRSLKRENEFRRFFHRTVDQ